MQAIITMDMLTNGITVIDKLLLLFTTVVVFAISTTILTINLPHSEYTRLEHKVREGRSVLADIERLKPYTIYNQQNSLTCNLHVRKTVAVIAIYVSDLAARQDGILRLDEPSNFDVQIQRSNAMSRVRDVLVCAPLDGDMWFRLSLLAFILNMDRSTTTAFLAWSERTAPQEAWIKNQRDAFARIYLAKH